MKRETSTNFENQNLIPLTNLHESAGSNSSSESSTLKVKSKRYHHNFNAITVLAFLALFTFLPLANSLAQTRTIKVGTIDSLKMATANAESGDVIIVENGEYTNSGWFIQVENKVGTLSKPITIKAQSIGGVIIDGERGFRIRKSSYVTIEGFVFKHRSGEALIEGGDHCRFTQNIFDAPVNATCTNTDGCNYLMVKGTDHEIDHNTFRNKNTRGAMLRISTLEGSVATKIKIHHNYFSNFKKPATSTEPNGFEALQFGSGGNNSQMSNSVVEYNLFENCTADDEVISNKFSGVKYRFNTIKYCTGNLTLRSGNNSTVYGNYFLNSEGVRIYGNNHKVHSNYFNNCFKSILIGNGTFEKTVKTHEQVNNCVIAFNTLYNNSDNITLMDPHPGEVGQGADSVTIANNIIYGASISSKAFRNEKVYNFTNAKIEGNIIYNIQPGSLGTSGALTKDPGLAPDGIHLTSASTIIASAKGSYDFGNDNKDIDGQVRKVSRGSVGADEYDLNSVVVNKILTPAMVGPNNLALLQPVNASSAPEAAYPASAAVDGDVNTRWTAQYHITYGPQTLVVDLGALKQISKTELVSYLDRAYRFRVEVSEKVGGPFIEIVNRTDNTVPGTAEAPITDVFPSINGQYVRLIVEGAYGYSGTWAAISEFRVFGTDITSTSLTSTSAAQGIVQPNPSSIFNLQAAPNPVVNGKVEVIYTLPNTNKVNLTIYNANDQGVVKTLVNADQQAGKHKLIWNTEKLPNGIYIIKLSSEAKQETFKVVIAN